ncbi:hypothetical protein QP168_09110 [Aerococcus urinae]|uniref:Uncharacterized protein n=1 Tax=Aerococcus mictus TaxID=2976810 RepID=A0A1E9PPI2_9LACT|nr:MULTISPECIES: hypothetical protein [Aerococcus]KAA9290013.1 hypothetical protein F6I06_09100 [Aerococcus mictus]MBU5611226.1 hypothetical protein [Aerococcus urinae]MCY3064961.1 hypothetical protein [Aerococcus mictus]MCY3076212.1 hypothetical protein [Aerococcus mictus]MCY3081415.1 hypothetical protein [Aerococcus mictus]
MFNVYENNQGDLVLIVRGTEQAVLAYFRNETNFKAWTNWIYENADDQEKNKIKQAYQLINEADSIEELEYIFDTYLDYSWWNLIIDY